MNVFSYGYDIWYHILEKCPTFTFRILRMVCKEFKNIVDTYYKLYDRALYSEFKKIRNIEDRNVYNRYKAYRNCVEINKLKFGNKISVNVMFKGAIYKDCKYFFVKGLLIENYNSNMKINMKLGPYNINIDMTLVIPLSTYFGSSNDSNLMYLPLLQYGSFPYPEYYDFSFETENSSYNTKISIIGEYKKFESEICQNILFDGNVITFSYGVYYISYYVVG